MKKIQLDRAKWRCGSDSVVPENRHGTSQTSLLNNVGKQCCLGLLCSALGVPSTRIMQVAAPTWLDINLTEIVSFNLTSMFKSTTNICHADWVNAAIKVNDDHNTTLAQKEEALKPLFLQGGFEIEFIGEY